MEPKYIIVLMLIATLLLIFITTIKPEIAIYSLYFIGGAYLAVLINMLKQQYEI